MNVEGGFACPAPAQNDALITAAHGGGGRRMQELLSRWIWPLLDEVKPAERHDCATLAAPGARLAFTTDSYVVTPLFFPGGDIGSLAVHGTINDLAMGGARPLALSAALIVEEGLPLATLRRIVKSMAAAARSAGVAIVTGDTKVIPRGTEPGLYITTAGIGAIEHSSHIAPAAIRPGDAIILSGDLGRHGVAVLSARAGLEFETTVQSDSQALWEPVAALLKAQVDVHCLRDLTRGGLASALVEIAEATQIPMEINEPAVPVIPGVSAACELLGLDPLQVANEGRFVAFVPAGQAEQALGVLQSCAASAGATVIGGIRGTRSGMVVAQTALGTARIVDMLSGEQLPRIC